MELQKKHWDYLESIEMSKFRELYNADLSRYDGHPSLYTHLFTFFFRKAQTKKFCLWFYKLGLYSLERMRLLEIPRTCSIGGGIFWAHFHSITINPKSIIGRNCSIYKGVTIGQEMRGPRAGCPTIGDNVYIGINATIVGKINIGDDVLIAANTFVNCDIPSHSIVFGNPCIIKHTDNATNGYIPQINKLLYDT